MLRRARARATGADAPNSAKEDNWFNSFGSVVPLPINGRSSQPVNPEGQNRKADLTGGAEPPWWCTCHLSTIRIHVHSRPPGERSPHGCGQHLRSAAHHERTL